jgi:LEA14-like dessication related protein
MMKSEIRWSIPVVLVLIAGCASLENIVAAPGVSLRNVKVESLDLAAQTFLLSFDVTNPNPFPLPINSISYAVELDGHRFASGATESAFTVPASGDGEFAISVDLNLLQTAPELMFIVRDGVRRDIPYALNGQLGVDIPLAKPVHFQTDGQIRLQSSSNQR